MQGGFIRGICLLAFLLSTGRGEELEAMKNIEVPKDISDNKEIKEIVDKKQSIESEAPDDLKNDISLAVTESNSQENEERSGAMAHSSSHSYGGSSMSNAVAHSQGDGSSSAYSDSFGGMSQSKATAVLGGQASPFSPETIPFISPGSGFSQAEAQAISNSGNSYNPGINSYPFSSSYPYSPGSSSAQAQAEANNGFYRPLPITSPVLHTYDQGFNSAQAQAQANNDAFYQPASISIPPLSPNNQGSSSAKAFAQTNDGYYQPTPITTSVLNPYSQGLPQIASESYKQNIAVFEPLSSLPKPISSFKPVPDTFSDISPSYSYSGGSSSAQAQAQAKSGPYQPIPFPNLSSSPYESFLAPNIGASSTQAQAEREVYQPLPIVHSQEKILQSDSRPYSHGSNRVSYPYQPIPFPDPNPSSYDTFLVPYKGSNFAQAQTDNESYKPIPFPKLNPKQYEPAPKTHSEGYSSASGFSSSQPLGLKFNSAQAQAESESYGVHPISDPNPSPYDSLMIPYQEPNSAHAKAQAESVAYQPISIPDVPKSNSLYNPLRSGGNDQDYLDFNSDIKLKSSWDPPSDPNAQLYPSGGVAAQSYAGVRPGAIGVNNPYNQGISPYTYNYLPDSPYRPGGFAQGDNEAQGPPNIFAIGQSSPIAFEDAKSRLILPHEYIFLNKMPGGENAIQCKKENEFHHFWSQALDCIVCICLNEYGLLSPVCASCGGCHNPPPKLPTPEPLEPVLEISEPPPPVLQPEPNPVVPLPEPYPPVPSPYPVNPEPVPTPALPTPSSEAACAPLPTGQPFTNPLHPCQICVCRESYVSGKPDVQIQCKENPQCIVPADVTTIPPLPDVPVPIPLPLCEKFPEHVLFPHPTDACKLCKCSKSLSETQVTEQQITCYPHPDCIPKLEPITEPGLLPPPLYIPIEPSQVKPVPKPPDEPLRIVPVEPIPWPPVTTIAPVTTPVPALTPRPGPLPGPPPHESCRPYPPNQPFQHPWDDCQLCMCSEAFATGMITVEVNCYTKPSCCVELPESLRPGLPGFIGTGPNVGTGPDIPVLPNGLQPGVIITSTYRPPAPYLPYSPNSIYPGISPNAVSDVLTPSGYPSNLYPQIETDDAFGNPPSSYPYQPNYHPGYVHPKYPPRLPAPRYPPNYQYAPGDAIGNTYPVLQGHFPQYNPRYQGVPGPNMYPSMYQRPNYEMSPMYPPGQIRDGYAQAQASVQGGSGGTAQSYAGVRASKSGNESPEDDATR